MDAGQGHSESAVEAAGRKFSIRVMAFENGAFVSVCEGASPRIGPLTVSMHAPQSPVTTPVIPARDGSLLLKMASEMVASRTRGIAAVTVSAGPDVPPEATRAIMRGIMEMV